MPFRGDSLYLVQSFQHELDIVRVQKIVNTQLLLSDSNSNKSMSITDAMKKTATKVDGTEYADIELAVVTLEKH